MQQLGIDGCGGESGGVNALRLAAANKQVEILALLTEAGVVDDGSALAYGVAHGGEPSVKFLLQQRIDGRDAYTNKNIGGSKPLLFAFLGGYSSQSPRIVRLLVDAGADTTSALRITNADGEVVFNDTPLSLASRLLREKDMHGKDDTEDAAEEQLHGLVGIHRLLLRVEAAHAVSFLWPVDNPAVVWSLLLL